MNTSHLRELAMFAGYAAVIAGYIVLALLCGHPLFVAGGFVCGVASQYILDMRSRAPRRASHEH